MDVRLVLKGDAHRRAVTCRARGPRYSEATAFNRRTALVLGNVAADGVCEVTSIAEPTEENISGVVSNYDEILFGALERSSDHYQWAWLSRTIASFELTVPPGYPSAAIKFLLVKLSLAGGDLTRRDELMSELVAMGDKAVPVLLSGIRDAVRPSPIFANAGVANIPIFSMQALAKMECEEAIPLLIDLVGELKGCVYLIVDGKRIDGVVHTLWMMTGQRIGIDREKWRKWYESTR